MFPQVTGKLSQVSSNSHLQEQRSPYLLQYKVFEERLKKQEKQQKSNASFSRTKKKKQIRQEDYLEITKNILSKKQNYNIFEDYHTETQPTIDSNICKQELVVKTRQLFQNKMRRKRSIQGSIQNSALAELRQNLVWDGRPRMKSQSNTTHVVKIQKSNNNNISFIGYKRNKKTMIGQGFRKMWGII